MECIDQRPLTLAEVYKWCSNVFSDNGNFLTMRHPTKDWYGFLEDLQVLLRDESLVFNPVKDEMSPWIDVDVLQTRYEPVTSKRVNPKLKAETASNKVQYKRSNSIPEESRRDSNPAPGEQVHMQSHRRASTTSSAMPSQSKHLPKTESKHQRRSSMSSGLRASMTSGRSSSIKAKPDFRKSFSAYNPGSNIPDVRYSPSPNTTTNDPDVQGLRQSFSGSIPIPPLPINNRRSSQPKLSQSFRVTRDPPPAAFVPPPSRSSSMPSLQDENSVIAKCELQKSLFGLSGTMPEEQNIATLVKNWAHEGTKLRPLPTLLFEVSVLLSPENHLVEYPEYFDKWKILHRDEFKDDNGSVDDQKVSKVAKKCKLFLHPDKWPQDLDDDQRLLLQSIWDVLQESELF